jgi:chemotaxis protein MotB
MIRTPYRSLLEEEEPKSEASSPAWVITFSDMVTLMLCFFILLLSFASTDSESFRSAAGSVRQAFGAVHPTAAPETPSSSALGVNPLPAGAPSQTPPPATLERVRAYLLERGLADAVDVIDSPRGVVLRAKDRVLFASAEADLNPDGLAVLDTVKALALGFDGRLAIEGHSDDRPIQSDRFPSNWELSSARAGAVLRYLLEQGLDPRSTYVAGYAHTRPIADNADADGRAKNRRVEFVFEPDARGSGAPRP